ncbi:MAG: hypothetical protein AB1540_05900 [Bdellovibrionota bacterium]
MGQFFLLLSLLVHPGFTHAAGTEKFSCFGREPYEPQITHRLKFEMGITKQRIFDIDYRIHDKSAYTYIGRTKAYQGLLTHCDKKKYCNKYKRYYVGEMKLPPHPFPKAVLSVFIPHDYEKKEHFRSLVMLSHHYNTLATTNVYCKRIIDGSSP